MQELWQHCRGCTRSHQITMRIGLARGAALVGSLLSRQHTNNLGFCLRKDTRMASMVSKAHDALAEVATTGKFIRTASGFREIISPDHAVYKPEKGRYHLYISLACPWANRCLAVLKMKGLDECIGHTVVHPTWQRTRPGDENDKHAGWAFFQSGTKCLQWYS